MPRAARHDESRRSRRPIDGSGRRSDKFNDATVAPRTFGSRNQSRDRAERSVPRLRRPRRRGMPAPERGIRTAAARPSIPSWCGDALRAESQMNWKRGAIRLWLVAAIIWIGAVGFVERPDERPNPPRDLFEEAGIVPNAADTTAAAPKRTAQEVAAILWRAKIERSAVDAFVPPVLVLALGFCGAWVWRWRHSRTA